MYETVSSPTKDRDFTVVVPAYNPGPALIDVIKDINRTFVDAGVSTEIIVVDDGCTDQSTADLTNLGVGLLRGPNQGKGAALRAGLSAGLSPLLGFIDADGAYPASSLLAMYRLAASKHAVAVVGSRQRHAGLRGTLSVVFSTWVRLFHQLDFDTQAGIKVLSADLWADVAPYLSTTGFAIDVDILSVAKRRGWAHPASVPVTPSPDIPASSVTMRRSLSALLEVARIRFSHVPSRH